jgi:hypothetical protein
LVGPPSHRLPREFLGSRGLCGAGLLEIFNNRQKEAKKVDFFAKKTCIIANPCYH